MKCKHYLVFYSEKRDAILLSKCLKSRHKGFLNCCIFRRWQRFQWRNSQLRDKMLITAVTYLSYNIHSTRWRHKCKSTCLHRSPAQFRTQVLARDCRRCQAAWPESCFTLLSQFNVAQFYNASLAVTSHLGPSPAYIRVFFFSRRIDLARLLRSVEGW